jgi:hypothetical protein
MILFLVVSPPDRPADFLRAEEMLSWLLVVEDFRDRPSRDGTREEIQRGDILMAEAPRLAQKPVRGTCLRERPL